MSGCTCVCFCVLTTWLSVITRSRVSQQDLTAPRGNVTISSFRRPNTCSVVVSSLLPEEEKKKQNIMLCDRIRTNRSILVRVTCKKCEHVLVPPACSISLMQNLAVATAAGWWDGALYVNRKSLPLRMEHTPCWAALRTWENEGNAMKVHKCEISTSLWRVHYAMLLTCTVAINHSSHCDKSKFPSFSMTKMLNFSDL